MKNKASLALMELTVMVLVFALAAAGCIRCFVWAKLTSEDIALRDRAAALAANTAEAVKSSNGNIEAALSQVAQSEDLKVIISPLPREIPGLGEAEITVQSPSGEILFFLTTAWQEETK